jgi:hypothetical protein
VFSHSSFKVSGLTLRFLIHFKICILYRVRDRGLVSIYYVKYPVFPAPFIGEAVFSPVYVFGYFVKD